MWSYQSLLPPLGARVSFCNLAVWSPCTKCYLQWNTAHSFRVKNKPIRLLQALSRRWNTPSAYVILLTMCNQSASISLHVLIKPFSVLGQHFLNYILTIPASAGLAPWVIRYAVAYSGRNMIKPKVSCSDIMEYNIGRYSNCDRKTETDISSTAHDPLIASCKCCKGCLEEVSCW